MTEEEMFQISQRVLEQHKAYEILRFNQTAMQELSFEYDYDIDFNEMIVRLQTNILADHVAADYYEQDITYQTPSSTWQTFKWHNGTKWWLRWLVNRKPVVFLEDTKVVRVKVDRYLRYPEATIPMPELGKPVIYEHMTRVE